MRATGSPPRPTVYVVMTGLYEDSSFAGAYASLEGAMAAHPVREPRPPNGIHNERPGGWQKEDGVWVNGLDWQDYAQILECELGE